MDEESKPSRFTRASRRELDAVMRLYYVSKEKDLDSDEVRRCLFWVDAWEMAADKYDSQT